MMADLLQLGLLLTATGLIAGVSAGLFGVGGGFVVVPALLYSFVQSGLSEGQALLLAIGTSLASIVITSFRSWTAHRRRQAVDESLLTAWAPWLVAGGVLGLVLVSLVPALWLKPVFAAFVLMMSVRFLHPALLQSIQGHPQLADGTFKRCFGTGLGALSAMLGIGGGTLAVIVLTLAGRPLHKAIATAAGFGFYIAAPATLGFAWLGWHQQDLPAGSLGYVHLPALLFISLTSWWITPKAVRWTHALPEQWLSRIFGVYLLSIATLMLCR